MSRSFLACVLAMLVPVAASADTIDWQSLSGDGFESGGFGGWDVVNNPGGDLAVTGGPAALAGSFGMQATVDDTDGLYVQDDTPADEAYYRAHFRFDPNAFDPGEAQNRFRTRIFIGFEDGPRRLFAVVLRRIGGQYALRGRARLDDNTQADTPFVPITDTAHTVDLRWKRSSGPAANDGYLELWIDSVLAGSRTSLDNNVSSVDFVRMGALSVKSGASGVLYWDDFGSERRADPLFCETPFDGAHVTVASGVTVPLTGRSRGLTDVQVNGAPVSVAPDGTFSTTVPARYGLHFVELSGMDGSQPHTALCAFLGSAQSAAEGLPIDYAVAFRLQPSGVQKFTSLLPGWYARPAFAQDLHARMLTSGSWQIGGGPGNEVEITYQNVISNVDSVNVSITDSHTVNVRLQVDLRLRLDVDGEWFFTNVDTQGDVFFTNATIDFDIGLGIDPVSSRIEFRVTDINDFGPGTRSTQGFAAGPFQSTLMTWIANDFQDFVGSEVGLLAAQGAGLYSGLTDGLDTTVTGAGFPVERLDGAGTVTLAFGATPAYATWYANGLSLGTRLSVTAPPAPPGATGRIPLPAADFLGTLLPGADAWSSVNGGVFNLALQALWRAGLFDGTVPGGSLDAALPAGTSLDVTLRTMPVVTDFDPDGSAGLDVGSLDLVVRHPDLPSGLRVRAGGRVRAEASLVGEDLVFDGLVVDELHVATGDVVLAPVAQTTLEALVTTLVRKIGDIALNDSLPALPVTVFNLAPSMSAWGFPAGGTTLRVTDPTLVPDTNRVFLSEGSFP